MDVRQRCRQQFTGAMIVMCLFLKIYDDKLDDYCFATPGIYLIPLYLLVGSGSKDDKLRKKRLLAIIKRMRDQITESISTYHFNLDVEAKQEFAFSIIIDSLDRKKYYIAIIRTMIQLKQNVRILNLLKY